MDLTNLAKLCAWISERVEEFWPGRLWWVSAIAAGLALFGLGMMFFGLRLVRVLCGLLGPPAGALGGLVLAPIFGGSVFWGTAVGAGVGLFLGFLLYRAIIVVLAVEMLLTLLAFGVGWGLHTQVDWDYLVNLDPKIEAGEINPFQNVGKTRWQIFTEHAQREYQGVTKQLPWLSWVVGGLAVGLVLLGILGGTWLWRWTALVISLFFGVQLFLLGGGVFLLRAMPATFDVFFSHPVAFLIGLTILILLGGYAQYRLNRHPTFPASSNHSEPQRASGWAL